MSGAVDAERSTADPLRAASSKKMVEPRIIDRCSGCTAPAGFLVGPPKCPRSVYPLDPRLGRLHPPEAGQPPRALTAKGRPAAVAHFTAQRWCRSAIT